MALSYRFSAGGHTGFASRAARCRLWSVPLSNSRCDHILNDAAPDMRVQPFVIPAGHVPEFGWKGLAFQMVKLHFGKIPVFSTALHQAQAQVRVLVIALHIEAVQTAELAVDAGGDHQACARDGGHASDDIC